MTRLQRLVVDFRNDEEIVVRCLYRSSLDGPSPTTKARAREVSKLVRGALQSALEGLEGGDVEMVGVSGYEVREDILDVALPRPDELREAAS